MARLGMTRLGLLGLIGRSARRGSRPLASKLASRRTWRWTGAALVLAHALMWLACGVDGDRAMMESCPADEECSAATPEGLSFRSGGTFDETFASTRATAVGGTQTLRLSRPGLSFDPLPAFEARSDDPGVFTVESASASRVTVRGQDGGSARLRIVDSDEALLDRITLRTADVDRVELRGTTPTLIGRWEGPWAFFRGGTAPVGFALRDGADRRLVDESARPVGSTGVVPMRWDLAEVTFDEVGSELSLSIELGSGTRTAHAPLVGAIDRFERMALGAEEPHAEPELTVGGAQLFCYWGVAGDRAVAGLTFAASVEGPLALTEPEELGSSSSYVCLEVQGTATGDGALVVQAGGAEMRQPIRVVE